MGHFWQEGIKVDDQQYMASLKKVDDNVCKCEREKAEQARRDNDTGRE